MDLIRKISTAFRILKNEGVNDLFKKTSKHISREYLNIIIPSEPHIVFDVLKLKVQQGVMIDVGAHLGESLSPFLNENWQVYAFEPDTENRKKLIGQYGKSNSIIIDSRAVSDKNEKNVVFYTSKISTGISGLSSFHASHEVNDSVETITLKKFTTQHSITSVDFLKIDTEGFDLFVLNGFPWNEITPQAIVCEFEDSKTVPLGYDFHDLAKFLQRHDYNLIVSEWYPVIQYGGHHEWRSFKQYPCELEDANAWGNIIAIKDKNTYNTLVNLCKNIIKTKDNKWKIQN